MADYSQRTRTTTDTEFLIPRGSAAAEFDKAWLAAQHHYAASKGCAGAKLSEVHFPDHWARIDADDEHIIIRIETVKVSPA